MKKTNINYLKQILIVNKVLLALNVFIISVINIKFKF